MAHKYHDVVLAWLDGKRIQCYDAQTKTWEVWEYSYDITPPFGSGEWRVAPEASPVEKAGITKEDLLAYFDKDGYKDRNGLILRLHEDDGTAIPKCEVVVGNDVFQTGDLLWCDLDNMRKIFP